MTSPRRLYEEPARRVDELTGRLLTALEVALSHAEKDLKLQTEKLQALSPLNILSRGYSIAFLLPGRTVLKSTKGLKPKDAVKVRLHEG